MIIISVFFAYRKWIIPVIKYKVTLIEPLKYINFIVISVSRYNAYILSNDIKNTLQNYYFIKLCI